MLVLPHLLIHLPLLNIFLSDLTCVVVRLLDYPLDNGVLHLSLRLKLLLVRRLSSH